MEFLDAGAVLAAVDLAVGGAELEARQGGRILECLHRRGVSSDVTVT
jgi:hypothetical protein